MAPAALSKATGRALSDYDDDGADEEELCGSLFRKVRKQRRETCNSLIADNAHDIVRHLKRNKIVFYSHQ